jgi:hypothetical protein
MSLSLDSDHLKGPSLTILLTRLLLTHREDQLTDHLTQVKA